MRLSQPVPILLVGVYLLSIGCTQEGYEVDLGTQDVRLTVLHTSDWHSRLVPYDLDVRRTDEGLGLNPELGPYGGAARVAYLIERERANAGRSIFVDSGDCFQGAPIFNVFDGEVEFRALSLLRPDGVVVGNHEFDRGIDNLIQKAADFASFPLLAANYHFHTPEDPGARSLADVTEPFTVVNVDGLIVGLIGIANFSSLSSIGFADNSMGITPLEMAQTLQFIINLLQPQVHVIVGVSHAGLDEDIELIQRTVGLDLMMGGHLHVVLDPPRIVQDASGRDVVLTHSGAFLKYLGRLDVVLRPRPEAPNDFEVESHRYTLFPIDRTVPEDTAMLRLLEPYITELRRQIDVSRVLGYAPRRLQRFGSNGGDSEIGNFVTEAMRRRRRVETDFAITNSLGVRSDIVPGPFFLDQSFNIFPFPNTITTMTLSGNEVQELLDYNARRSASRGCQTQLQVAGIEFTMDCSVFPAVARDIRIGGEPILPNRFYTMATNNYIAAGGSGFRVLQFNNTKQDTGITIRDVTNDAILNEPNCLSVCQDLGGTPDTCALLQTCRRDMTNYAGRFCAGLDIFSDQEYCLDELAPSCLEESHQSDFEICRQFIDPTCDTLYLTSDREACYVKSETDCLEENRVSPRSQCAIDAGAGGCLELDDESEFEACMRLARIDAEDGCLVIPCLDSEEDGRIQRILPSNEFVPTGDEEFDSGEVGAALTMEGLQHSEHNHEACY